MNLLVTGGLLIIGVIALVALVFVIRSEPVTKESASIPPPVPTEQEASEKRADVDESSATMQVPPTPNMNAIPSSDEQPASAWQPLANEQFYELKNELHSLHGQAQEFEYRIRTMVEMVERVEQVQNGRLPIE